MKSRRPPALLVPCVAMMMHLGQGALAADDPLPTGGLLVHVGCGSGGRTVEFVGQGEWLVHGLDGDRGNVEKAQKLICPGDRAMPPPPTCASASVALDAPLHVPRQTGGQAAAPDQGPVLRSARPGSRGYPA